MSKIINLRPLVSFFPLVFFSLLICCPLTHAANGATASKQPLDMSEKLATSQSPIHITADRMETNQDENTITFESHVIVQQDDVTVTSNRLKVTMMQGKPNRKPSPAKGRPNRKPSLARTRLLVAERIDYIEFEGDVKVTHETALQRLIRPSSTKRSKR